MEGKVHFLRNVFSSRPSRSFSLFPPKGLCCGTSLAGGSVLPSAAVSPVPDSTLPAITIKEVEQLLREVILIVALTNIITTMMYLKVPGTSIRSAAAKGGSSSGSTAGRHGSIRDIFIFIFFCWLGNSGNLVTFIPFFFTYFLSTLVL